MKGQDGSFSCDWMSALGNDHCHFIERKKTARQVDLEIIGLYLEAMQLVLSVRMSGDVGGAEEGDKVLTGLVVVR
jgi:hypothetical protein